MNSGLRYFPEKLHTKTVRVIPIHSALKMYGMSRPQEVFYSVAHGNWSDFNTWETVSGRVGRLPTELDDVYIRHTVTFNPTAITTINHLFVSAQGHLQFQDGANRTIIVNGNIQATGTVDLTSVSGAVLTLKGNKNYINTFISGSASSVQYGRLGDQDIMDLQYHTLNISGIGTKTLTAPLTLTGNLVVESSLITPPVGLNVYIPNCFETGSYPVTVTGTTTQTTRTIFSKTGQGDLLFIGLFSLAASGANINFLSNPAIEFRGGITSAGTNNFQVANFGTGLISFTTNNQSLTFSGNQIITFQNVLISGAITVTNVSGAGALVINGTLDGNNAASTFDNRSVGSVQYKSATAPMVTGVLNCNGAVNTWLYNLNGAQDITGGTYRNLTLSVGGVKRLLGNVSVINTYTLSAPATLNSNGFALTNP